MFSSVILHEFTVFLYSFYTFFIFIYLHTNLFITNLFICIPIYLFIAYKFIYLRSNHIETSQFIFSLSQVTGFFMLETLAITRFSPVRISCRNQSEIYLNGKRRRKFFSSIKETL